MSVVLTCRNSTFVLIVLFFSSNYQQIIALILSDVIGDPLEFIASAPTFYSGNKAQSALDIIKKYELMDQLPLQLLEHLQSQTQLKNEMQQYFDTFELHFLFLV